MGLAAASVSLVMVTAVGVAFFLVTLALLGASIRSNMKNKNNH
jgi:hypothetical protein